MTYSSTWRIAGEPIDVAELVDPQRYMSGLPHDMWGRLRRESPVHWCEIAGYRPFWAITRHADVKHVSTHPEVFSSAHGIALMPRQDERRSPLAGKKNLINTDPPEHRDYRNLAGPYFRPGVLRSLEHRVREISQVLLDGLAARDPTSPVDFVADVAARHPLRMLCEILGVAEQNEAVVLRLATEIFGGDDPEYRRDRGALFTEAFGFLAELIATKRADPGDDLASVLAHAEIGGEPVADTDLISYLVILITAGHETTRNAISGGLLALVERPDQLALLRDQPELCGRAADEIVRWVTPVLTFLRTANHDTELAGQPIRAHDAVALFYASANFDEDVFGDPFTFRVDRDPNPHLGWGVGEHYCLGATLARMETRVLLEELIPRLEHVELAGEPQWLASYFTHGLKHLPIRWRLATTS